MWYNENTMPQVSSNFQMPYPIADDPVNVHGDIKNLVDRLNVILPPLGISAFQLEVVNVTEVTIPAGYPVYITGYSNTSNKSTVEPSLPTTTKPVLGITKASISPNNTGTVVVAGVLEGVNTSGFQNGDVLYVKTGGGLTNVRPEGGSGAVGVVAHAETAVNNGIIIVEAKGNGTWGALRDGLA